MRTKNYAYKLSGILMIVSGFASIVTAVLVFISRISASDTSLFLTIASATLALVYSIINIVIGFSAAGRTNSRRSIMEGFRLGVFSVVLFVFQILLSAANGIVLTHLIILAVCGFILPCFYLIASQLKI